MQLYLILRVTLKGSYYPYFTNDNSEAQRSDFSQLLLISLPFPLDRVALCCRQPEGSLILQKPYLWTGGKIVSHYFIITKSLKLHFKEWKLLTYNQKICLKEYKFQSKQFSFLAVYQNSSATANLLIPNCLRSSLGRYPFLFCCWWWATGTPEAQLRIKTSTLKSVHMPTPPVLAVTGGESLHLSTFLSIKYRYLSSLACRAVVRIKTIESVLTKWYPPIIII